MYDSGMIERKTFERKFVRVLKVLPQGFSTHQFGAAWTGLRHGF